MKTSQALKESKRRIQKHGWPNVCVYLALPDDVFDWRPAADVLEGCLGVEDTHEIWQWNDAPERTVDEVYALYDEAIKVAKILES
jgi:hypothetical protein